ncbi:MAG: DHA2 family efflux MFS transporter permease subunit [Solirubrobacterales bacterium]|nr:DHA2 family efflux MFS transporter permease subunit [Solirubrobacterales bacterium]
MIERKWWTLTAVSAGLFMLLLDISIVIVALPSIQHELGGTLSDLQWVIDAYALSLAALLLTTGSLADLRGRRKVFAVGIGIFTAGSLLCGLAPSTLFLTLARAGQGVGGAIMFSTSLALLANAFRGRDRGIAFGVYGAIAGIAVAVGPVLGGAITSGFSWRWIFLVNVPIGAATLAATLLRVDESRDPDARRPDLLGFATFSSALFLIVYGLIESGTRGWGSAVVLGCLAGGGGMMAVFFVCEALQRRPMLDLSLLRVPTFVGGLTTAFAISGGVFAVLAYIVIYLQDLLHFSAVGSGLRLLALTVAMFVMSGVAGRLTGRVSARLLIAPGLVLVGVGLLLMRGITPASSWTHLLAGLIVAGIGSGLVNVTLASTAVGVVHPSRAGMASGVNSTARQVGYAAGIAALGTLLATEVRNRVVSELSHSPLAHASRRLAEAISTGNAAHVISHAPAGARGRLGAVALGAFTSSLNELLLVAAIVSLVGGMLAFVLIRQRDFVSADAEGEAAGAPAGEAMARDGGRPQRVTAPDPGGAPRLGR